MRKQHSSILLLAAAMILAAVLGLRMCQNSAAPEEVHPVDAAIEKERQKVLAIQPTIAQTLPEESLPPYESPIDFEALQAVNPDVCGWLDIPDTDISYPILLRETDNGYYLDHAENGYASAAGCIFVENYNHRELTDPALAIYGHHLRNGAYFGNLQNLFETKEGFEAHRNIIVYTPDREIHFQVFAAVPYSNAHLLYTYHFANRYEFRDFIQRVSDIRSFSAQIDLDALPEFGQQLVILSTCLKGDNTQRCLVIGKAVDENGSNP